VGVWNTVEQLTLLRCATAASLPMKILVLGSAAAGGSPRWNCHCPQCTGLRSGTLRGRPRTPGSVAVSADGQGWLLVNASPELAQQLRETPALQSRHEADAAPPIRAVLLTDARLEHVAGLLSLRDGPPLELYCTPRVFEELTSELALLPVLDHYCGVRWHLLPISGELSGEATGAQISTEFRVPGCPGLRLRAVALPGLPPAHSARRGDPAAGDAIALLIEDECSGERLFHAPSLQHIGPTERDWMARASCILVGGLDEPLSELATVCAPRKVLTEAQHDQALLDEGSAERRQLAAHGIEVAHDGMEIDLGEPTPCAAAAP
jgi:pyrroloquinoline quinone biosynthesis protein B